MRSEALRREVLQRLAGYFDGETVEAFASDEALEVEELLDLLCRAAGLALEEADDEAKLEAALADLEWGEGELEIYLTPEENRALDAMIASHDEEFEEEEMMGARETIMAWMGWVPLGPTAPRGEFSYDEPCHTQAGPGGEEIKPHVVDPRAVWRGFQIDDQDRGGIPDPGSYQQEETVEERAAVVLAVGQTFKAPDGYVIKEYRPGRAPIYYGSIARARKARYQAMGSKFVLVGKAKAFPA